MASRLPTPGSDDGTWGNILNDYLSQVHKTDGTLKDGVVTSTTLAAGSVTTAAIADGAIPLAKLDTNTQNQINSASGGAVTLSGDVTGPSTATKVAKVNGVAVSNSPAAAGQVLMSGSTTTASWQDAPSGGSGGSVSSVAGKTGAVTLPVSDITGLASDLAGKASTTHTHVASDISGTIAPAQLGTGTRDGSKYLRDDGQWAAAPSGGGGSTSWNIKTAATGTFSATNDDMIFADPTTQGITINLPAPVANGRIRVKRTVVAGNYVVIAAANGGQLDKNEPTMSTLNGGYSSAEYVSDGTNWWVF